MVKVIRRRKKMGRRKKKADQVNLLDIPEMPVFVKLEVTGKNAEDVSPIAFQNIFTNIDIMCDRNSLKNTLFNMGVKEGSVIQTFSGTNYLINNVKMIEKEDYYDKSPVKWIIFNISELK